MAMDLLECMGAYEVLGSSITCSWKGVADLKPLWTSLLKVESSGFSPRPVLGACRPAGSNLETWSLARADLQAVVKFGHHPWGVGACRPAGEPWRLGACTPGLEPCSLARPEPAGFKPAGQTWGLEPAGLQVSLGDLEPQGLQAPTWRLGAWPGLTCSPQACLKAWRPRAWPEAWKLGAWPGSQS